MPIRKRLLMSNIAMIIIPIVALLFLEMIMGFILIFEMDMKIDEDFQRIRDDSY